MKPAKRKTPLRASLTRPKMRITYNLPKTIDMDRYPCFFANAPNGCGNEPEGFTWVEVKDTTCIKCLVSTEYQLETSLIGTGQGFSPCLRRPCRSGLGIWDERAFIVFAVVRGFYEDFKHCRHLETRTLCLLRLPLMSGLLEGLVATCHACTRFDLSHSCR